MVKISLIFEICDFFIYFTSLDHNKFQNLQKSIAFLTNYTSWQIKGPNLT